MDILNQHYLTDTLLLQENSLYATTTGTTLRKVTKSNWHHYLCEIGWSKFPRKLITFLNQLSETREKNSLFGLLQCPQDGDCLFHCIANALNSHNKWLTYHNSKDIRTTIANSINEDDYQTLISVYRAMKDADDYENEWNPHDVHDIDEFRQLIKQSGHSYWGDSLLIQIIASHYDFNILIYHSPDEENIQLYTLVQYEDSKETICLWFESNHFQLIGHYNGDQMISVFPVGSLPQELLFISQGQVL